MPAFHSRWRTGNALRASARSKHRSTNGSPPVQRKAHYSYLHLCLRLGVRQRYASFKKTTSDPDKRSRFHFRFKLINVTHRIFTFPSKTQLTQNSNPVINVETHRTNDHGQENRLSCRPVTNSPFVHYPSVVFLLDYIRL